MAYSLDDKLVIAISSRVLFKLEEENSIYVNKGLEAYYDYQLEKLETPLEAGSAFGFVQNLLAINKRFEHRVIEVVVLSRNNATTGLRIGKSIDYYNLDIQRSGFTAGRPVSLYLEAFKVDLFLSACEEDVVEAINQNRAAATILPHTQANTKESDMVKIAFDGDAVLFGDESESLYQEEGLDAFVAHERKNAQTPLSQGPFLKFLKTVSTIQNKFGLESSPIRTALVTARDFRTHERALRSLHEWGVHVDEAFFQGGVQKSEVVQAFGADIFFDDQEAHLKHTQKQTPSAKVPSRLLKKA